jgi:DNA invertase Pin-like site-specific DNA recombinase
MTGIPNSQAVIRERREKLFIMLTRGMRASEIAKELKVDRTTVVRDIQFLTQESQNFFFQKKFNKVNRIQTAFLHHTYDYDN